MPETPPPLHRREWLPMTLVAASVLLVLFCAVANRQALGSWQWGFYGSAALALAGLWWFRRKLSLAELDLETRERTVVAEQLLVRGEREEFTALQQKLSSELEKQALSIDKREQTLMRKLASWQEWLEYPEPVDLHDASGEQLPFATPEEDARLADLAQKDRQLAELLEKESKRVFDNILKNKYSKDGEFKPVLMRDDAYLLIHKVARIYRPDVKNPLMEASVEQLARAASRACLHFLTVVEQLPLNVQQYNVSSLYSWVKQGVKAYGIYRSARPYFPYINSAYYATRFAMGVNPFALLAWWATSEVVSRSASAAATRLVNQKALALLHDVVRVLGYEVAGIYGGDARHRDPNWIYAAELTEMVSRFPLSREVLVHSLKEVGSIPLLNEYDRIYLYRCLATHRSAQPQRYRGWVHLNARERQAIAGRLEKFFDAFIHGKNEKHVERWRIGVENRIETKLKLDTNRIPATQQAQVEEALRSLASFLVAIKQREPDELPSLLAATKLAGEMAEADREKCFAQLIENPPYFFDQPNVDPSSDITDRYLADLARLAVRTSPTDLPVLGLLEEVAAYLRRDEKKVRALLDNEYLDRFQERWPSGVRAPKVAPAVARAAIWLLEPQETMRGVYSGLKLQWPPGVEPLILPEDRLHLLVTDGRLLLVETGELPAIHWVGDSGVQCHRIAAKMPAVMSSDCLVTGGVWTSEPNRPAPDLRLSGTLLGRFETYFGPLLKWCEQSSLA